MTTEAKILTLWNEQADSLISRRQELKRRDRQLYRLITRMKFRQQELEEHQQPLPDGEPGQMMLPGDIVSLKLLEADHHDVDQIRASFDEFRPLMEKWTADMTVLMCELRDVIHDDSRSDSEQRAANELVNRIYDAVEAAGKYLVLSDW